MIKLYKRDGPSYQYWEAWEHKGQLTIHQGKLGHPGHSYQVPLRFWQNADSAIERAAAPFRARGYEDIPIEAHAQLIVQYRTKTWGDAGDLEKRHKVEDVLNECLGWTGNGHCDGGDIGSGTINTFSFVVDPELAAKTIVSALRKAQLLEGATIARDYEEGFEVLWPRNFPGAFNYSYGA